MHKISQREIDLMKELCAKGMGRREISQRVRRAPSTIDKYLGRIASNTPPAPRKAVCTHHEVCRFPDGGVLSTSHGNGKERAKHLIRALIGDRKPLPGYPRTEKL